MEESEVLTIREASLALNLSEARVHQLLASGQLDGPGLQAGRRRHAAGAPRVTAKSITRYLQSTANSGSRPAPRNNSGQEGRGHRHPYAAQAAAQELKVRMDTLRDEVRRERARSRQLLQVATTLLEVLRDSADSADRIDDVTEGYAQALTQLLSSDLPPTGTE